MVRLVETRPSIPNNRYNNPILNSQKNLNKQIDIDISPTALVLLKVTRYLCFKIRPLLHVSLNNFVARPSVENLRVLFLTKWPRMSKVTHFKCVNVNLHLKSDP